MADLRRLVVVLLAFTAFVLGLLAIGDYGNVIDELGGGVMSAGLAIVIAHL